MSEFCDRCPMRGAVKGEIEGIVGGSVAYEVRATLGYGPLTDAYRGSMGVLYDRDNNQSLPFKLPSEDGFEKVCKRIDACEEPFTEERGMIRKRTYVVDCPAIGHLAIRNGTVRQQIANTARVELT